MKYAVIIKHPGRDYDWRVDVIDIKNPDDYTREQIERALYRKMLGSFEILAITAKVDFNASIDLSFLEEPKEEAKP